MKLQHHPFTLRREWKILSNALSERAHDAETISLVCNLNEELPPE